MSGVDAFHDTRPLLCRQAPPAGDGEVHVKYATGWTEILYPRCRGNLSGICDATVPEDDRQHVALYSKKDLS